MKVFSLFLALVIPFLSVQAGVPFSHYLTQTAGNGEAESQFILGLECHDGWSGKIQANTAASKWHDMAVEMNDQRALLLIALLRKQSDRVAKNEGEAIRWLQSAAQQGDDYARVILGDILLEGDGIPANWVAGTELIKKSAYVGFPPAQLRMGMVYLVGGATTPKDEIEALAWFIVAADAGSSVAREFRDERTQTLGREIARLAVRRSRILLGKTGPSPNAPDSTTPAGHARS